jgi:phospholipid-transporting ATPase
MFVHGREAYRRNSLLILYTFYKNILYVTTQFFFGFWSSFSGQPLYEPVIYQLYNMTMTAAPIMYFALFDFEHHKDYDPLRREDPSKQIFYFMKHPHLYRIGLEYSCYGVGVFLKWVAYGLSHALMIYIFNFYFLLLPG